MINIIPYPYKITVTKGSYTINASTTIVVDDRFIKASELLSSYLAEAAGISLKTGASDSEISMIYDNNLKADAYILTVKESGITIAASNANGAIYAVQSMRQMFGLYKGANHNLSAEMCVIEDCPRYVWRGIMLDEARHFFGKAEVKRLLDLMTLHKLNVFHWHLTDAQGWRIEIKKYPLLTEIGATRECSQINGWAKTDVDNIPVKGHYTQEDIIEIVRYATELGIIVVPEIDMPGHFMAAIAAYPHLSCGDINVEVPYYFGNSIPLLNGIKNYDPVACVGKESTYQFVSNVIDELCELFPAPYIHIGGDEVPKDNWQTCPTCQSLMAENGLASEDELQGYFNNRVYEMLKAKGKKLVGWNEILRAKNINTDVIGQYWLPGRDKVTEDFINRGGKIIMSKHESFYFDMSYAQVPLKNTYNFMPIFQSIKAEAMPNIIGVEAPLWTEWVADRKKFDCSLFPRMTALSEVCWSSEEHKNFDDFLVRLDGFNRVLDSCGVWYAEKEVALCKGLLRRNREVKLWHKSDQHVDVKKNEIAKSLLLK